MAQCNVFERIWLGAENKFAALRFKINGQFHYAGLEFLFIESSHLQIIDCAFEDTPLANIPAGDGATDVQDDYSSLIRRFSVVGKMSISGYHQIS